MITYYKDFILEKSTPTPEEYGINHYNWNNGFLDCYQDVILGGKELENFPFKFGKIYGSFDCSNNQLTSLLGCPLIVDGYFNCSHNQLKSLEGCPKKVGSTFYCNDNKLTSLEHCPEIINDYFFCNSNKLTSLEYCPKKVVGGFGCMGNKFSGIEDYPLCITTEISDIFHFSEICEIVKNNVELFEPLLNDKIKFHQMVMRMDNSLIQYYTTIRPPAKKTLL